MRQIGRRLLLPLGVLLLALWVLSPAAAQVLNTVVNFNGAIIGILPVGSGGSGAGSLTAHGVLLGNSTSAFGVTAVGATNTLLHGNTGANPTYSTVVEGDLSLSDITTANVSTSAHGLVPKAPNDTRQVLRGDAAWAAPLAIGCLARSTATTSIPDSTFTTLALAGEIFDTDNFHDNVTNNSRLTIPRSGAYVVSAISDFTANGTGVRELLILKNGVALVQLPASVPSASTATGDAVSIPVQLAAGDYLQLQAWQNSGLTLTNHNSAFTYFGVVFVGD